MFVVKSGVKGRGGRKTRQKGSERDREKKGLKEIVQACLKDHRTWPCPTCLLFTFTSL